MKEITVLSGKGGTGKTSITAALASVAKRTVFCDNDVDAADLHLLLHPQVLSKRTFFSGWQAQITTEKCSDCGLCYEKCRFGAISINDDGHHEVNALKCEGCRLCERLCPNKAIESVQNDQNHWYVSDTRFGPLVHATMGPGEENSGKLVAKVRAEARAIAMRNGLDYVLNDGPPGIGCTAISAISGTDVVLIVIEASNSGWHDAERLIRLLNTFKVKVYAIINKSDINTAISDKMAYDISRLGIELITKIPFEPLMLESLKYGRTVVEFAPESKIVQQLKEVWKTIS